MGKVAKEMTISEGIRIYLSFRNHEIIYEYWNRRRHMSIVIRLNEGVKLPKISKRTVSRVLIEARKRFRRYSAAPIYYLVYRAIKANGYTKLLSRLKVIKNERMLSTNAFLKQTYKFARVMGWSKE